MPSTEDQALGWSDQIERIKLNGNFKSDDHALKTGMAAMHLRQLGVAAELILDKDGNYTPRMILRGHPFGAVIIEVLPPQGEQG